MAHLTASQFPNTTLISGTVRTLDPTGVTTASATKATVATLTLGTTLVQLSPEATVTAAATVPTAPAAWNSVGWQADSTLVTLGDPGTTAASSVPVVVSFTASTAGSVTFTVVLFAGGVEIGRGVSASTAVATSATAATVTVSVAAGTAIAANAKLQMSVYALLPANVSLGTITYTYNYGTGAGGSQVGAVGYTVQAARAESDSGTTADSPTRRTVQARPTADSGTATDTPSRAAAHPRATADTSATVDGLARVVGFTRAESDTLTLVDTPTALTVQSRAVTDSLTETETLTRALIYGRTTADYPPGVTPDYPVTFPTKSIAGVVRLSSTSNPYLGGATVVLVRDMDGKPVQTTTSSTVDGSYSFARDTYDPYTYSVRGQATISSVSDQDVTRQGLVPS